MDPTLRELIDRSKLHQGSLREVAALLPATDDALAALLAETCTGADHIGSLLVMTAALDSGRIIDAAQFTPYAGLCITTLHLGCFAWKLSGDVPAALLAALAHGRFEVSLHAGMLFVIVAWCAKHRGGQLPTGFAAEARLLSRRKQLPAEALSLLAAAASLSGDATFLAVLREYHPGVFSRNVLAAAVDCGEQYVRLFEKTAGEIVPLVPANIYINYHPIRRSVDKISRNDPCRCGSGKKYKRCCFDEDRERLSFSSPVAGKTQAELRVAPDTGLTEGRLKAMVSQELARLDPCRVPLSLRTVYIMRCAGLQLLGRLAEAMEVMTFDNDDDFEQTWNYTIYHS